MVLATGFGMFWDHGWCHPAVSRFGVSSLGVSSLKEPAPLPSPGSERDDRQIIGFTVLLMLLVLR